MWIKWKRRGNKVISAPEDKNPWEKLGRKRQKLTWGGSVE